MEERLGKLESRSKRKETLDDETSKPRGTCASRLNKQRLETSLEAFSHCTQQLHHQVEVLKSHKRQLGHLPASEITSLELSLSLLERCLHHLRSKEEEEPSQPPSPPQVTLHQTSSDVKQAFNTGAGIGYPSSSGSYRMGDQSAFTSCQNGDGGSMQALHISAKNASSVGTSQGSRPGSIDARESMYHFSPMNHNGEFDEDESWLEYDSSVDANATMAAKIKSLVANPKWGRLYYRNGASELTRSLAHILYTKEELILSTVTGRNGFEALDNVKLMAIREAVEKKYGHATSDFDQLWKQCVTSLGQHCKYLRQKSGISHSPQLLVSMGRYRQESPEEKPIITNEKEQQPIIVADLE